MFAESDPRLEPTIMKQESWRPNHCFKHGNAKPWLKSSYIFFLFPHHFLFHDIFCMFMDVTVFLNIGTRGMNTVHITQSWQFHGQRRLFAINIMGSLSQHCAKGKWFIFLSTSTCHGVKRAFAIGQKSLKNKNGSTFSTILYTEPQNILQNKHKIYLFLHSNIHSIPRNFKAPTVLQLQQRTVIEPKGENEINILTCTITAMM